MFKRVNDKLMFTDSAYANGKKLVQVYIPAFSSLYFGLGNIWGFPAIEQVVGSGAVIATFLGVCLGLSSKQYDDSGAALEELAEAQEANADGELVVETNPKTGNRTFSLQLNSDPDELAEKRSISFKVVPSE